jgi:hypothetical protein
VDQFWLGSLLSRAKSVGRLATVRQTFVFARHETKVATAREVGAGARCAITLLSLSRELMVTDPYVAACKERAGAQRKSPAEAGQAVMTSLAGVPVSVTHGWSALAARTDLGDRRMGMMRHAAVPSLATG